MSINSEGTQKRQRVLQRFLCLTVVPVHVHPHMRCAGIDAVLNWSIPRLCSSSDERAQRLDSLAEPG